MLINKEKRPWSKLRIFITIISICVGLILLCSLLMCSKAIMGIFAPFIITLLVLSSILCIVTAIVWLVTAVEDLW